MAADLLRFRQAYRMFCQSFGAKQLKPDGCIVTRVIDPGMMLLFLPPSHRLILLTLNKYTNRGLGHRSAR